MATLELALPSAPAAGILVSFPEVCRIAEWSEALTELAVRSNFCPRCALVVHAVDLHEHLAVCSGTS